jgi:23S rRNA (pseudouridine1915-N3)-methyltransferase
MEMTIIKIGKPSYAEYSSLVQVFQKRLKPMAKINHVELKAYQGIEQSDKSLVKHLAKLDYIVCLDETGKRLSSVAYAELIQSWQENPAIKHIGLIIGGPYGLTPSVTEKANATIRLSDCTFPSDLAWLVLWEQTYRAFSILSGSQYHHV